MYNIVILAEQAMTAGDAQEVVSLHEDIEDARHYHVLIPCDNAALRVEHALGTLAAQESLAPVPVMPETSTSRRRSRRSTRRRRTTSAEAWLRSARRARGDRRVQLERADRQAHRGGGGSAGCRGHRDDPSPCRRGAAPSGLDVPGAAPPWGAAAAPSRARATRRRGRLRPGHHRNVAGLNPRPQLADDCPEPAVGRRPCRESQRPRFARRRPRSAITPDPGTSAP